MTDASEIALLKTAEEHHKNVADKGKSKGSAQEACAAGRALIAAKAAAPGKGWLKALKDQTTINPRTFQRYMLLARTVDLGLVDANLAEMSFSEAYRAAMKASTKLARQSGKKKGEGEDDAEAVPAEEKEEHAKAFKEFKKAVRVAMNAGVPFKHMHREMTKMYGAKALEAKIAA